MQSSARQWNNEMFIKHPTPYTGLAGLVQRIRARQICSIADIKPTDSVLEVGCEAGNLMVRLPECNRLVGVDISDVALHDAENRFRSIGRTAEFLSCDATERLPFCKGEFSVIICAEVLEHVSEPRKVIENILRISEPTTRIILSVPNEEAKLRLKTLLSKIGIMRLILPGIETVQSEWHVQSFSKSSFIELISSVLSIVSLRVVVGLHIVVLCKRGIGEHVDALDGGSAGAP
jgi:2-polyprenyl-3-methyl-5-hydroxy-6-metoxy-1,4-benzoquinol methylase